MKLIIHSNITNSNKKAIACGKSYCTQANEFSIPTNDGYYYKVRTYCGVAAQMTLDYYAEKGIDLKQIV